MEHVIAYIDLCLTCAMKKGRAKKGVVVKPLVSSSMGSRAQVNPKFGLFTQYVRQKLGGLGREKFLLDILNFTKKI